MGLFEFYLLAFIRPALFSYDDGKVWLIAVELLYYNRESLSNLATKLAESLTKLTLIFYIRMKEKLRQLRSGGEALDGRIHIAAIADVN